jgi:GxxExxY protein
MSSPGTTFNPELLHRDLTDRVIGCAIEVHRLLGHGLLESTYEECLCHELHLRNIGFRRQVDLPVAYKGVHLDCGYRMDVVVENSVILEIKCVERLASIHDAQLLTYLRLSGIRVGLLINFNSPVLKQGIIRRVV